jgi:hypothetical protein
MAADLASRLKLPGISVIEFGVAGGNGLVELESIAQEMSKHFRISISVFGLDTGEGMPEPLDYRDQPYVWDRGFYKMDREVLQSRLSTASLLLGDVGDTVPKLIQDKGLHPIGFVAFDLDYYSSTCKALAAFSGAFETRLPRVFCYFDDTIWPPTACHGEYLGELCAIREYNLENAEKKLCKMQFLHWTRLHPAWWNDQMYVLHDFWHPLYCTNVNPTGDSYRQKELLNAGRR